MSLFECTANDVRLKLWEVYSDDGDTSHYKYLKTLWAYATNATRNFGIGNSIKQRFITAASGITVRWESQDLQSYWDEFAESPLVTNNGTLAELLDCVTGAMPDHGEIFILKYISDSITSVPLKLQLLEAPFADPGYFDSGLNIKGAIARSSVGEPLIYHFFKSHPGKSYFSGMIEKGVQREPVSANRVIHVYRKDRPGAGRGIPWLTPGIISMHQTNELVSVTLVRQASAQSLGWAVTTNTADKLPSFGGTIIELDKPQQPSKPVLAVTPGGIHYFQPGQKAELLATEDIGANLLVMLSHLHREISSVVGLPYELVSGDLSNVTFSALKFAYTSHKETIRHYQRNILIDKTLKIIVKWFLELYKLKFPRKPTPKPIFDLPPFEPLDRLVEAKAIQLELETGIADYLKILADKNLNQESIMESAKILAEFKNSLASSLSISKDLDTEEI